MGLGVWLYESVSYDGRGGWLGVKFQWSLRWELCRVGWGLGGVVNWLGLVWG